MFLPNLGFERLAMLFKVNKLIGVPETDGISQHACAKTSQVCCFDLIS